MSRFSELKERLARLNQEQRALLTRRLAAGRDTSPSDVYLEMVPAVPLRTEVLGQPGESPRQIAVYPASHGQQRMWLLHEYSERLPVYVIPSSFHLVGPLDEELLIGAVADVVRRHDTLRTTFVMKDGQLFQHVASGEEFAFEARSFQAMPEGEREAAAKRFLEEAASRRFDLAAAPGFRVVLARLGPEEHVLCLVLHHIISDGWSRSNLWRDVTASYKAQATGAEASLPLLPVQFADYAAWQQSQLSGGTFEKQAGYWKMQLAGKLEPLNLPSDRPRPVKESFRGARASLVLDAKLIERLTARAREEGATLFMILLAAYKTLLHRYTSSVDLLVGVPIANRQRVEVEALVGFLVNTLVMRTDLSGDPTFRELLGRVKETAIQAYAHQDMPFDRLVEMLQIPRQAGVAPVFQAGFALQDFPPVTLELPDIRSTPWPVDTHTAKFDLHLAVEQTGDGWVAMAEYSTDLFDADRVERMLGHWRVILESIANDPGQTLAKIPLLTEHERQQILVDWNRTGHDYPRDKCIQQLFEEQVQRSPDAVAVVCEGESLTYLELNTRANRLADHLQSLGVGPDVLVGLCTERSLEMVVGMLGILKAGGAYLPLDPNYPAERLNFILQDSRAGIILTDESPTPNLGDIDPACSFVKVGACDESSPFKPARNSRPDALAYVIYTSGSTGTPKGVAVQHSNVVSFLHWVRDSFSDEELSGVLALTSISFDISVFEIFGPLCWGGKILLARDALESVPDEEWSDVRVINTVPSLMETWLRTRVPPASLLTVNLAGEPLKPSLVEAIYQQWPVHRVNDLYGPTETTIYSTWTTRESGKPATIGRPIANTQVYILDANLHPVPCGMSGELFIGGAGVARGYLHRQELTAEKFIPNPFNPAPNARLYRTGDLARFSSAGTIEYLGRADQQVKLRGFRIELGEIEAVLEAHPQIRAVAVNVQRDEKDHRSLTAYLILEKGSILSSGNIRVWLQRRLPDYMIPSQFVELPALPVTTNGKLDRKALERLDAVELPSATTYEAPRSELQTALVGIWQAALGRQEVGIRDNFFYLGGHSLLAVVICLKMKEVLGMEIPLRWIFLNPTIETLSERIEALPRGSDGTDEKPDQEISMRLADRGLPLPASFAQQGMWLLQQTLPDPSTYNLSPAWILAGPIDRDVVRRALRIIQLRHEVLRTSLVYAEGNLLQCIAAPEALPLPWQEMDLRELAEEERAAALQERLLAEARQPFDLAHAPLWRAVWIQTAEHEQVLGLSFHHSIMDEWSMRLFVHELQSLYDAGGNEESAGLPELPVQYADYAVWQRERLTGERLVAASNYWGEQLRDLPPLLEWPADLTTPSRRSGRGGFHTFHLPREVVARLDELSRQENATRFMTALAAYQVWLYRYTGQSDQVVATPITSRERPEFQNLIGFFLNTLPIRSQVEGGEGFRSILGSVRQTVLDAFEQAILPFEKIVELAVTERGADLQPLHQVMFVLLEQELPSLCLGSTNGRRVELQTDTSKCDLTFSVIASDEGWDCKLEYASDLFSKEFAAQLARHLKEILEAISEAPNTPVDQLRLMPEHERQQILVDWNRTVRDYPRDKCIQQLFEEQVQRSPDAVAVVSEGESLTYLELNTRANRLAGHLQSLGVGPDVLVGLCTERSLGMIVALLGILKAGGAYLPLDPKLPRERLKWLLDDTKAPLILCQRTAHERLLACAGESYPAGKILLLEDLAEGLAGRDGSDPPCGNTPLDLAYVLYTSGTTGQPKGVMVTHRGIVRLVVQPDYVKLGSDDVLLQFAPLSFDASTFEIWSSLLNGAKLVVPRSELLDFTELGKIITGHRVTTLWLTAALFHQMMERQPAALVGVRQLLAGGDVLSPAKVREYLEMPGHGRLINGYGPTENTTFTCCGVFDRAEQIDDSVPIGRPISGTSVYILSKQGEPVPVGVVGELYAGGDGLARGYLNARELTETRFVADPFSLDSRARLYKTGDLVRWRSDGNIEFVGRADQQVKIRGYRIELGEIEHALRRCHGVSDAAVVASVTKSGDKMLLAYLVAATEEAPASAALRAELAEMLPEYMIPGCYRLLDQLPLGSNGKLDRKALERLDGVELPEGGERVVASTELERRMVEIWKELLGKDRIGVHDNFFELGGHSIQAAQLAVEIEKLVGQKLPISALFESPTIASLARRLSDEQWAPAWSSLVPLQPMGSKPPLFVVHGVGGDVYGFLGLAKHFAPAQPVYGIQAVGLDGSVPRHASVDEMAAHYIKEIRSFQPDGPYHLCGYSMGGLIAYEMARQLHHQGQTAILILLDTFPTAPIPVVFHAFNIISRLPGRFLVHFRRFWAIPMGKRASYIRGRLYALRNLILRNRAKPHLLKKIDSEGRTTEIKANESDYFVEVSRSYRLSSYSGSLDYFACEDSGFSWKLYWGFLTSGRVRFHRAPVQHGEILAPHFTPELAQAIVTVLNQPTKVHERNLTDMKA